MVLTLSFLAYVWSAPGLPLYFPAPLRKCYARDWEAWMVGYLEQKEDVSKLV